MGNGLLRILDQPDLTLAKAKIADKAKESIDFLVRATELAIFGNKVTNDAFGDYLSSVPERIKARLNIFYEAAVQWFGSIISTITNPTTYTNIAEVVNKKLERWKNYLIGDAGIRYLLRQGLNIRQNTIFDGNEVVGYYNPDGFNPNFVILNDKYWRIAQGLGRLCYPISRGMSYK